jgi:hypothetical protein
MKTGSYFEGAWHAKIQIKIPNLGGCDRIRLLGKKPGS